MAIVWNLWIFYLWLLLRLVQFFMQHPLFRYILLVTLMHRFSRHQSYLSKFSRQVRNIEIRTFYFVDTVIQPCLASYLFWLEDSISFLFVLPQLMLQCWVFSIHVHVLCLFLWVFLFYSQLWQYSNYYFRLELQRLWISYKKQ